MADDPTGDAEALDDEALVRTLFEQRLLSNERLLVARRHAQEQEIALIRAVRDLPGQQLFKWRAEDGSLCPLTSDDVNAYVREAMGEDFSAKDFRTWAGTVSAARAVTIGPIVVSSSSGLPST